MTQNIEYRAQAEVRLVEQEGHGTAKIVGYAAVFNALSKDLGGFREQITPGAFKATLERRDDVAALFSHSSSHVLGRLSAGTLRMKEDEVGLLVEIDPPNTTVGRDVVESIRRGDLDSMSFGFVVDEEEWTRDEVGEVRTLNSVSLFDVSVVTWPAYPDTEVAVRSLEHFRTIEQSKVVEEKRNLDLTPTKEMARLAERGLELREEFNRGGTEVGVARARDLKNRKDLSVETLKRMSSFFARHRVDLDAPAASRDHKDYPSAGVIAWMLWGGDPHDPEGAGVRWVRSKIEEAENYEEDRGEDHMTNAGSDYGRRMRLRIQESE